MFENRQVIFHSHTPFCHHCSSTVPEMCARALKENIRILGFSDHAPIPGRPSPGERMEAAQLGDYLSNLRQADLDFPELHILHGFEADYSRGVPGVKALYRDCLKADFLIGSVHYCHVDGVEIHFASPWLFTEKTVLNFLRANIVLIESGVFDIIAHPDAIFCNYHGRFTDEICKVTRQIMKAARKNHVPLEVNANGIRKPLIETEEGIRYAYPVRKFWEIASDENIDVIVGSDAHSADMLADQARETAYRSAEELGLHIINAELGAKLIDR